MGFANRFRIGLVLLVLLAVVSVVPVGAQTVQRSVNEYVAAQGTFCLDDGMGGCVQFVPPLANFFGWGQPNINRCAAIDYAGIAGRWLMQQSGGALNLGTTTDGTVTERPLGNNQAEVTVLLHTRNALTWAIDQCADFSGPNLLFGHRAPEVLAGAPAALGESFMKAVFLTQPGLPLPDLLQIAFMPQPGQTLTFLSVSARADGPLREAYGVLEGTPGRLTIVQTGLFMTPFMGAVGDGFPAEYVTLQVVGSRKRVSN